MSKGSSPRPYSVSQETFANNFDAIFRKPDPRELEDAKAEDEAFNAIGKKSRPYDESDGPNRNTSNF